MNQYQDTLHNKGKLYSLSRNLQQGDGSYQAVYFLHELIEGFAKYSKKYIDCLSEAPFIYRERQLASLLAPSLSDCCEAFLAEMPVSRSKPGIKERKSFKEDYLGWVDFWANYKGYDFYIELKHDYDAFNSNTIRKSVYDNWDKMNKEQLPYLEDEAKYLSSEQKGVFTVSLHVITIFNYWNKKYGNYLIDEELDLIEIQKKYFNEFKEANWCGLWTLHPNLVEKSHSEYENHLETYPGLLFLSKIKKIS